ncbi:TIGR00730 family Rossman fold protein [Nocardioidaceae bacterium]|nr:TIGR00730 family Rossman fold protein [Nocardioidaceae bacterium]
MTDPDRAATSVLVFCGSRAGEDPAYARAAASLGREIAARGLRVVFGGGRVGLMGEVADAALAAGGEVVGVIPQHLEDREVAHESLTGLEVVGSMHERKARMYELADAVVVLPGGFGTLDELFETLTWNQLGLHRVPVGLLDVAGYWAPLVQVLDASVTAGFVDAANRDAVITRSEVGDLLDSLLDGLLGGRD